jgi:two-component system, chemotaxis family, CheB/CheR fusion protein
MARWDLRRSRLSAASPWRRIRKRPSLTTCRAAIGLGDVDFVLPPAEIGQTIAQMGNDPLVLRHAVEQGEVPDRDGIKSVMKALNSAAGIDLSYYRPANLNRRIRRRMLLRQIAEFKDYAKLLADKPAEALALSNDIMIGVTAFFREGANVDGLSEFVFPQIPLSPDEPVRIWVRAARPEKKPIRSLSV